MAEFEWQWPRFWWGCFGGFLYQFLAVYPTAAAVGWAALTLVPGVVIFSAFGGFMSVAAGLNSAVKCVGVGAATPAIITALYKSAPEVVIQLLKGTGKT